MEGEGMAPADAGRGSSAGGSPGATVIEMFSRGLLSKWISPVPCSDAGKLLADLTRGQVRDRELTNQLVATLAQIFWQLALGKGEQRDGKRTLDDLVLHASELLALIDWQLARPAQTAGDAARTAEMERELAEARAALDAIRGELDAANAALAQERADRERERAGLISQAEGLARDLANERAARETTERARLDELRRALAALREEHASAAAVIASLTELAAKAGAAHAAINDVLTATGTAAQTNGTADLAALRIGLAARLRTLEAWIERVASALQSTQAEIEEIGEEDEQLQAELRTGGARPSEDVRRAIALNAARKRQIEAYSAQIIAAKKPVEEERDRIRALTRAIDLVAAPPPSQTALPEIPDYPEPPEIEAVESAAGTDATPTGDSVSASPLSIHLAVVLYELVRQRINDEPRVLLWVARCAKEAGILARHALGYGTFTGSVLSGVHRVLADQFLAFRGRIGGVPHMSYLVRTDTLVPPEWEQLVTDEERERFVAAFRACMATAAAAKLARAAEKAKKPQDAE